MAQLQPSSTVKEDDGIVLYYKNRGTDEAQNKRDLADTVRQFAQSAVSDVQLYNQKVIMWIRPTNGGFALKYRSRNDATLKERLATVKYSTLADFDDFADIFTGPLVDASVNVAKDLVKVVVKVGEAVTKTIDMLPLLALGGVLVYAAFLAKETKKAGA
jgi:hypothetical protein